MDPDHRSQKRGGQGGPNLHLRPAKARRSRDHRAGRPDALERRCRTQRAASPLVSKGKWGRLITWLITCPCAETSLGAADTSACATNPIPIPTLIGHWSAPREASGNWPPVRREL